MIHPEQRGMLTDALTPPPGFVFDSGVATTYSLDLITLLTLPLHLAWLGSADDNANQLDDLTLTVSVRTPDGKVNKASYTSPLPAPDDTRVRDARPPRKTSSP